MKLIALRELPQGQQPGEEFETTDAMGEVLILTGSAKRVEDDAKPRRTYNRRDMQAQS